MNLADYTPETICRAIGLPSFDSDAALADARLALRLLLRPSFDPEVCITILAGDETCTASVVAAKSMVWLLDRPGVVKSDREVFTLPEESVRVLVAGFEQCLAAPPRSGIQIDGMSFDTLLRRSGTAERISGHVAFAAHASFVAGVIEMVWKGLLNIECKNALARAASYTGLEIAPIQVPVPPPATGILVLGSPEDRRQLLSALGKPRDK